MKKLESSWCSKVSTARLRRQCNQVRASPVCDASHMPRSNPAPYVDAEIVDMQIERRKYLLSRLSVDNGCLVTRNVGFSVQHHTLNQMGLLHNAAIMKKLCKKMYSGTCTIFGPRGRTLATSLERPPCSVYRKQTLLDLETPVVPITRSFRFDVLLLISLACASPILLCNHFQPRQKLSRLGSSGSASASRAPRHLAQFARCRLQCSVWDDTIQIRKTPAMPRHASFAVVALDPIRLC